MKAAKTYAARVQSACLPAEVAASQPWDRLAVAYLTDDELESASKRRLDAGKLEKRLVYMLKGRGTDGEDASVSFSEIESFTVVQTGADQIELAVVRWPVIAPADLLKLQPTYSELVANHRIKTALSVDLTTDDGEQAVLYSRYTGVVPFSALQAGSQVDFYCGDPRSVDPRRFWWAIPSVVLDKSYPYRTVFLK